MGPNGDPNGGPVIGPERGPERCPDGGPEVLQKGSRWGPKVRCRRRGPRFVTTPEAKAVHKMLQIVKKRCYKLLRKLPKRCSKHLKVAQKLLQNLNVPLYISYKKLLIT